MPVTTIRGGRQITDGTIPYVDIQQVAASRLVGNPTGSAATMSEISLGTGLSFSGTSVVLSANLQSLSGLSYSSASFVKMTAAGTFALDTNTYALSSHTHSYFIGTTAVQTSSANQALTGITGITFVSEATDVASITTTISSTSTFFDFNLADDNNNDEWRWRFTPSGGSLYNAMRLVPVSNTASNLIVSGTITGSQIIRSGGTSAQFLMADGSVSTNPGWITSFSETDTLATVVARGNTTGGDRPITLSNSDGAIFIKGSSGGWAMATYYLGSAGTNYGGFGALGSADTFSYFWVGAAYNNTWMTFTSSAVNSQVALQQGGNQVLHAGNYNSYAPTLTGTGASGTWGISITGNADTVDGYHASVSNNASYAVVRDGSGDIFFRYSFSSYVNTTDDVNTGAITNIIAKFGDNYHRSASASSVQTFLGLGSMAYASSAAYLLLAGGTMSGKIFTVSTGTGTYDTAIEIRETGYANTAQSAWGYSPAMTFHWGGRYAKRFGMRSDGLFAVDDEPLALRSWVTSQGYITGYSETDTLATVTSRGATTTGAITVVGSITVSSNNATGGGIILADDGDIVDLNDAFCSMRFSSGVKIYSANRGGTSVITLASSGAITASGNISGGYIFGSYFNASSGNSENPTIGQIWTQSTGDDYLRKSTPAHFISQLGILTTSNYSTTLDGRYFFDRGFGAGYPSMDANTMPANSSAFTYANNAPLSGCIAYFGAAGYGIQLNGDYSGNSFSMRSRNGDNATWTPWKRLLTDYNYNDYSPTKTGGGASGTWGISITGSAATATSATYLNSSNYIQRIGSSGNYNTDFQNTPAGSVRHQGDDSSITNSPGGTWWFVDNYRHSNGSNYWGTQIAWGWEDNANKLAQRNITGGTFGSWIYYLNSGNYNSYSPTLTGGGASGTWSIVSSQVTINYNNDSNSTYQMLWGSGNSVYGTAGIYCNPSSDTIYTYAYRGNGNVGGTGEASWHPAGIYSGGTNWLYGTVYLNGNDISGAGQVYANGWFRSNTTNTGLYSQVTSQHWSSKDNGYWDASSTTSVSSIRFFTGSHIGSLRGYVYATNSNEIGFLDQDGNWVLRCLTSNSYLTGTFTATGDVVAYSDARIKTNVKTIENALEKVTSLRGVKYNRTDIDDKSEKIGVIAQEIQKVIPQVVNEGDDGMLGVSYGNLAGVFIEAFKEQQAQIEDLKKQIAYLVENR